MKMGSGPRRRDDIEAVLNGPELNVKVMRDGMVQQHDQEFDVTINMERSLTNIASTAT